MINRLSSYAITVVIILALSGCGSDPSGTTGSKLSNSEQPLPDEATSPTAMATELPPTAMPTEVPSTATTAEAPPTIETPTVSEPTPPGSPQRFPDVAAGEQVILFGSYEGDTISATTLWGQDEVTQTARVMIDSGETPLYVILTSYEALIWRFEGDVARVHHVVLLGWAPHGVTGIAADRVTDLSGTFNGGSYFYSTDSPEAQAVQSEVESALAHPVDILAGSYTVGTLSLPSTTVTESTPATVPIGFDSGVYSLGLWFNPGGVMGIAASTVVSASSAEPYEILPEGFGLAQLVATGALEVRDDYFYIVRAIPRFPAGLAGAHAVTFVLGTGVPIPAGDPAHSCVISEETGLPIGDGFTCSFFQPPTPICDIPQASLESQIVLFGTYEADAISTTTIAGLDEVTQTARVVVAEGSTPLYVAFVAFDNIIWRFEGATERIERLVLAGYGTQAVTGVPPAVVSNLSGGTDCVGYFYDVQSPEGVTMRRALESGVGRSVDVMAGSYSVGTLSLPAATAESSAPSGGFNPLSPVPPGFDPLVYQLHGLWFTPGGVIEVDPSLVIGSTAAEPYDVLPQGFGLAQLVAAGGLEVRGSGFPFGEFYIAHAIPRFPAGLYGAHLVSFILGRGIPLPAGSAGHSCVISEETGLPLNDGPLCGHLS